MLLLIATAAIAQDGYRDPLEVIAQILDAKTPPAVDGVELLGEPRPCPYAYCNCTVPQARGMMGAV